MSPISQTRCRMKWKFLAAFISAVLGGAFTPAIAQGTFEPIVTLYASDPHASEAGPDAGTFTVRRTGSTDFPLIVFYNLSGTASNGLDYERLDGTVQIPAGELAASFTIKPITDGLLERDEIVVAQLDFSPLDCATCGYAIGIPSNAIVVIAESATNFPPQVRMVAPGNGATFITPTNLHLIAFAYDRQDSYFVRVEFFEGTNSLGLGTFNGTRCAYNCPNYILIWSNVPPGEYMVSAKATDSEGATGISEPVHITVLGTNAPPGTNLPLVSIAAIDPIAIEGQFCQSNWWWTTSWNGGGWVVTPPTRDTNTWYTNHCLGTNTATFIVRRSGPTNSELTVYYAIRGTASNGVDYAALPGTVTIPAAHHTARIQVIPSDDTIPERIETVVLGLQPPPYNAPSYAIGQLSRAAAIILDNDQSRPPTMSLPDGIFHLCRPATNGYAFRVSASADLVKWTVLCTNTVTDGAIHFLDTDSPGVSPRFYRIVPEASYTPTE